MSLENKYPQLQALSMFMQFPEINFASNFASLKPLDARILYICGLCRLDKQMKALLQENKELEIVFLCLQVEEVLSFMQQKQDQGFDHERVHLVYKEEQQSFDDFCEQTARQFPYEKTAFMNIRFEEKDFSQLQSLLSRKLVLERSVHKELLHYKELCKNLFANVKRIQKSFDIGKGKDAFKHTPAIILGAGPSLQEKKEFLRSLEDDVLMFAGGSTITALDAMGISPHLGFLIDPNRDEYERVRHCYNHTLPVIYGNRVQKDIFRFFSADFGYIRSDTGGLFENYVDETLGVKDHGILKNLSEEALSVTSIALMTAIYLGCNPIYFAGVDLGYNDSRYSTEVLDSWQTKLHTSNQDTIWNMEKRVIEDVVDRHKHIQFYQISGKKAVLNNVDLVDDSFLQRGKKGLSKQMNQLIKSSPFSIDQKQVDGIFSEMKSSLGELITLIKDYLEEKIPYSIFEFSANENKSYQIFFKGMVYALFAQEQRALSTNEDTERNIKAVYEKVLADAIELSLII